MEKMYDLSVTSEPRIKIGTLESTNQWIANLIRKHHSDYPEQQYRLYEIHDKHQSMERLLNFDIHLALTNEKSLMKILNLYDYMKNHIFY